MKWTDENIKSAIQEFAQDLSLNHMPTSQQFKSHGKSGLLNAISRSGGVYHWSEVSKLPRRINSRRKWSDSVIEKEIIRSMSTLHIKRMPTSSELLSIGRSDLQNAITKHGGFRHWRKALSLNLAENETNKGQKYEVKVSEFLKTIGHKTNQMTTGHPYDLLVNENVKVDVKVGSAHYHFGCRAHTFRPSSEHSTCDIYICIALDEDDLIEKIFVIPSKFAKVKTINISGSGKYYKFINRWCYIEEYTDFYQSVTA